MDIHDVYTRLCRSIHLEIHIHDLSENLANILNDIITTSNTKAKKDKIQSAPIPLIFDIKEENGKFSSAFHNFQMKVFPEYFIDALPTNFPAEIILQK